MKKEINLIEELTTQSKTIPQNSLLYWKLRCKYLEKTLDQTYSVQERDNCRMLYNNLAKREL